MTEDSAPWNHEVTTHRQLLLSDGHGIATYCDVNPLQDMRPECHIASGEIDANFRVWQTLNRVCTMTSQQVYGVYNLVHNPYVPVFVDDYQHVGVRRRDGGVVRARFGPRECTDDPG